MWQLFGQWHHWERTRHFGQMFVWSIDHFPGLQFAENKCQFSWNFQMIDLSHCSIGSFLKTSSTFLWASSDLKNLIKKNILFGDNIIYKTKNCKQIAAKNTLYGLKMDKNRAIIWFTSQKMGENKCKLFCLLRNWCISARGAKNCTPSTEVLSKVRHACWDWRGAI